MQQPKGNNSFLKRLRRSETCRLLRSLPWLARGISRVPRWKDSLSNDAFAAARELRCPESANPLRSYFDSVNEGRGVWKWLHYFDIYHRHFQKFIGEEVHVVEIGIYSGGSLDMWKAYFGPKCRVYGVDTEPACKTYEGERTEVFIGDQSDRSFWKRFRAKVPQIDIVIDDGGHLPEQQITTLEETLPYMRAGGVYFCEDVGGRHNRFGSYLYGLTESLNESEEAPEKHNAVTPSAIQSAISSVHLYPFVVVIEKVTSPADLFIAERHGTHWQPFL